MIVTEIARLQAKNDELDAVCTARQLKIYKLQALLDELAGYLYVIANNKELAYFSESIELVSGVNGPYMNLRTWVRKACAALAKVKE